MPEIKQTPEMKVYAVGCDRAGKAVCWAIISSGTGTGSVKFAIPTSHLCMAQLAERGMPVKNGEG